jgi:hypothetical protein
MTDIGLWSLVAAIVLAILLVMADNGIDHDGTY